jgi:predicted CXXCH cytochrome family protein
MRVRGRLKLSAVIGALTALVLVGAAGPDLAQAQQSAAPAASAPARTPVPKIARGKGDKCVAPTEWMRRFHMTALGHKRDDTVHDGIRTPQFSLKGCIDCHQVGGADGKPVTVKDERHFCRTCHDYAAVQVDCFDCHASRPEAGGGVPGKGAHHGGGASEAEARHAAALGRYLAEGSGSERP